MWSVGVLNEACTSTRPLLMQHSRASYPSPSCYRRCKCNVVQGFQCTQLKLHVQWYLVLPNPSGLESLISEVPTIDLSAGAPRSFKNAHPPRTPLGP